MRTSKLRPLLFGLVVLLVGCEERVAGYVCSATCNGALPTTDCAELAPNQYADGQASCDSNCQPDYSQCIPLSAAFEPCDPELRNPCVENTACLPVAGAADETICAPPCQRDEDPCPDGTQCYPVPEAEGGYACLPPEQCDTEGSERCADDTVQQCVEQGDGIGWRIELDCGGNDQACSEQGDSPECRTPCTDGETRCVGNILERCVDGFFAEDQDCSELSGQQVCVTDGAGATCREGCDDVGETRCDDDVIEECTGDPAAWTIQEECEAGQVCVFNNSTHSCVNSCASEGEGWQICDGLSRYECRRDQQTDRLTYEFLENCDAACNEDSTADPQRAICTECDPNSAASSCVACNRREYCDATGNWAQEDCPSGQYCNPETGRCSASKYDNVQASDEAFSCDRVLCPFMDPLVFNDRAVYDSAKVVVRHEVVPDGASCGAGQPTDRSLGAPSISPCYVAALVVEDKGLGGEMVENVTPSDRNWVYGGTYYHLASGSVYDVFQPNSGRVEFLSKPNPNAAPPSGFEVRLEDIVIQGEVSLSDDTSQAESWCLPYAEISVPADDIFEFYPCGWMFALDLCPDAPGEICTRWNSWNDPGNFPFWAGDYGCAFDGNNPNNGSDDEEAIFRCEPEAGCKIELETETTTVDNLCRVVHIEDCDYPNESCEQTVAEDQNNWLRMAPGYNDPNQEDLVCD